MPLVADEALLLLRMDPNIALAGLASSMPVLIGAECSRGVHDTPPDCAWKHCHEKYVWTPVCFTTSPHHGLLQSYPGPRSPGIRHLSYIIIYVSKTYTGFACETVQAAQRENKNTSQSFSFAIVRPIRQVR